MNHLFKLILISILFIFLSLTSVVVVVHLTGNQYLIKGLKATYLKGYTSPNIYDIDQFYYDELQHENPKTLEKSALYNKYPLSNSLEHTLDSLGSIAFLVIRNNKLIWEKYYKNHQEKSISNGFSMTKTLVSILLFKAIMQGYIKGLDQPASDFFSEYSSGKASKLTVGDLSAMATGLDWKETSSNPFNITSKSYYGTALDKLILSLPIVEDPGKKFEYQSGNTHILSLVLRKATGKSLTTYAEEEIWKPMRMESNAFWSLDDKNGVEKAFCCLHATARDFAKLGLLLMQNGRFENKQILDSSLVKKMVHPVSSPIYGYSVWMDYEYKEPFYYLRGHRGQYVINIPNRGITIVRLGQARDDDVVGKEISKDTYLYVDSVLELADKYGF